MKKALNYNTKEKIVKLAGSCFWYWNGFYSFLESCGVKANLYKRFPKDTYSKYDVMRNVLSYLEENKDFETINNIVSEFFRLNSPVDDAVDIKKAKSLLQDFKEHIGTDPIERAIAKQNQEASRERYEKNIEKHKNKAVSLKNLHQKFCSLINSDVTPQKLGFELEKIFMEILLLEEFEYNPPYRTNNEQIDGVFRHDKFDYLIEIKFESALVKKDALSIFDGKIRGKAQSTRGFFLAMNGFDQDHIKDFMGHSPRLVLMDGQELVAVLDGRISLYDLINSKVRELVKSGEIFYKINI